VLPPRNVVITGANSGIGLETAVALSSIGDRVAINNAGLIVSS
jgi:NAD(P)-dependent dehydrogenase (short-subunit alcohol dehydrogenase family)